MPTPLPRLLFGLDEVGTSALAGPIVVGACHVPEDAMADVAAWGWADCKALKAEQREALVERLLAEGEALGICWATSQVDPPHIDLLTPLDATYKALRTALLLAMHQGGVLWERTAVLVDGEHTLPNLPADVPQTAQPKADQTSLPVMIASVIARVERDKTMARLDTAYPIYEFARNGGHPTLVHLTAILKQGPVFAVHRRHYLRKVLEAHYDRYLKFLMKKPSWLVNNDWLHTEEADGVAIPKEWPTFSPDEEA